MSSDKLRNAVRSANIDDVRNEFKKWTFKTPGEKFNELFRNAVIASCAKNRSSHLGLLPHYQECVDVDICQTVNFLLDAEIDLLKPTKEGNTCLFAAVENERYSVCELLLKKNANVNEVKIGLLITGTPLHAAVRTGNIEIINLLLNHGADPSIQNQHGTPLHGAVRSGKIETVKLLLEHGLDFLIQNKDGDDILQFSGIHGERKICEYLVEFHQYSRERVIECYELCGAWAISGQEDERKAEAVSLWKTSLELRKKDLYQPYLKKVLPARRLPFRDQAEFQTIHQLEAIETDTEALFVQAVLVYWRILGFTHRKLKSVLQIIIGIFKIRKNVAHGYIEHAINYISPVEIESLKYMFDANVEIGGLLTNESLSTLDLLVMAHLILLDDYLSNNLISYHVKCDSFLIFFECLTKEFEKLVNCSFSLEGEPKLKLAAQYTKLSVESDEEEKESNVELLQVAENSLTEVNLDDLDAFLINTLMKVKDQDQQNERILNSVDPNVQYKKIVEHIPFLILIFLTIPNKKKLEKAKMKRLVWQINRAVNKIPDMTPLLHRVCCNQLLCDKSDHSEGSYEVYGFARADLFPSPKVAAFLIQSGCNVNGLDFMKHSPLHVAADMMINPNYQRDLIELLIKCGGHLDQRDEANVVVSDLLQQWDEFTMDVFGASSLQCLAAQIIMLKEVPFAGLVPVHLEEFIEMH